MTEEPAEPLLYRQLMDIRPKGMSNNQWLNLAGVNRSFFTDLRKRGRARTDIVDKLVQAVGVAPSDFYAMSAPDPSPETRRDEQAARQLPFLAETELRDIPVVGTAMGADYEIDSDGKMIFSEVTDLNLDEVHDYARRPLSLKGRKDVYVVVTVGESMSPRMRPGDPMYVDPKAQPRIGDDVVVYLRREEGDEERTYSTLVKELSRSASSFLELTQHNPSATFRIDRKEISAIHRIIPWRELTLF